VKVTPSATLQILAGIVLFAILCASLFAVGPASKTLVEKAQVDTNRWILFDSVGIPPPYVPQINPFSLIASMNSWTTPILDHTGKPHHNGHVIQVIMDGGNGRQDPPNPDGTPGGDDSLAYGNFNMMCLCGLDVPDKLDTASGMFYSKKYFIPYEEGRAYYLRLWEGSDIATAPYYQDTKEYDAGEDRGGAMITMHITHPLDVDWKFGSSIPRPPAEKAEKPKEKPKK